MDGRVNVFWNHEVDMLDALKQGKRERLSREMQPAGQSTVGGAVAGFGLKINRRGSPRRNWGMPGKRARVRMRTEITVKYLDRVKSVAGITMKQ